jgi:hypothetical protein
LVEFIKNFYCDKIYESIFYLSSLVHFYPYSTNFEEVDKYYKFFYFLVEEFIIFDIKTLYNMNLINIPFDEHSIKFNTYKINVLKQKYYKK